jgi:acyl-CoA synthetase (AMP-forming)/AMP-acid ligase II
MTVPADVETIGEAVIAGPTVFDGYLGLGLDEANEEAFDDGWVGHVPRSPKPWKPCKQTLTHFMKLTSFFLY